MSYTIKELAELSGITTRTLRYYHQIGLLLPDHLLPNGYRIYENKQVDRLQQILFFRELDLPLEKIGTILDTPENDTITLLTDHRAALVAKQKQVSNLISLLDKTIASYKGEINMSDQEKFSAFKTRLIAQNEENYGEHIREKYGETAIDQANETLLTMTCREYETLQDLEQDILTILSKHPNMKIPSKDAHILFQTHKKWLSSNWGYYDHASYAALVDSYLITPEFKNYYDKRAGKGATQFLVNTIQYYLT